MITFIKDNGDMLTATLKHKMTETLLFIQSFDSSKGANEIDFVENYRKIKESKSKSKKSKTEERKRESEEDSEYGSE